MKPLEKSWIVLLGVAALGCADDRPDHGVDTGLAAATALRDVSSADSISACQKVRSAVQAQFPVDQNVRKACELYGAALTDTRPECQAQADTCVTQTNSGSGSLFTRENLDFGASLSCDGDISGFAGCELTVGEYESCLNARIQQVEELFSHFSCTQAASVDVTQAQGLVQQLTQQATPSACERLMSECPQADPFEPGQN
jgi:hypothetical protein